MNDFQYHHIKLYTLSKVINYNLNIFLLFIFRGGGRWEIIKFYRKIKLKFLIYLKLIILIFYFLYIIKCLEKILKQIILFL